ncbi:MAG: dienelactone hydrolase family protein [Alphaproteobacteria bacterium]|nr:dienelactone hydrolase family protein [Alphaproteobacteria bacterium]
MIRASLLVLAALTVALVVDQAVAGELVRFRAALPMPSVAERAAAEREGESTAWDERPALTGVLSVPLGTTGRVPAVVLLHGCAGITAWNRQWTRRLLAWGYAVLDVDSFGPRGRADVCDAVFSIAPATRALDAFGAKEFLSTHPRVDADRVAVLGMSHGGWAGLIAARASTARRLDAAPFRAVVTLYPWCDGDDPVASPTLILVGEHDDWTPAPRCAEQVARLDDNPEVILKVYPGAHHGFDFEGLDVVQAGHVIRHDTDAAADAVDSARRFLAAHLGHE